MSTRADLVKIGIKQIINLLNVILEHVDYDVLEEEKRFIKIFKLLMEISKKSNFLRQVVNESYFI